MSHPLMIGMLSTNAVVRPELPEPQLSLIGGHAGVGQSARAVLLLTQISVAGWGCRYAKA
jgi:hypothetical protein